jgi:hypothetical protein
LNFRIPRSLTQVTSCDCSARLFSYCLVLWMVMLLSIDLHEDFIDEEGVTVPSMLSLQSPSVYSSELDAPEPDGLVADCDATFGE